MVAPRGRCVQALLPRPPPGLGLQLGEIAVHADTPEAELLTLHNRVLMRVPEPTQEGQRELRQQLPGFIAALQREVGLVLPWSRARSARHFIQRKGFGLYGQAFLSLDKTPLGREDTDIALFLKAEKWVVEPGDLLKPARAIQYRGPRYNIELGRYLLPLEETLWSCLNTGGVRVRDNVWLYSSKGLTPDARAGQVATLWSRYPGGRALCLDHSRFDAHLSQEVLRMEHEIYLGLLKPCRLLRWLLAAQCKTRGRTKHGRKYRGVGGRMSGDVNTALGNTIVSALVLLAATHDFSELSILVEGDDGVVFGPGSALERLEGILGGRVLPYGFELKISSARTLGGIDYCSGRVIVGSHGKEPMWVRAWPKPMATDPWTAQPVFGQKAMRAKAYTMAVSAWVQYEGLPVYQAWAQWLLSHCSPAKFDPWYDRDQVLRLAPLLARLGEDEQKAGVPGLGETRVPRFDPRLWLGQGGRKCAPVRPDGTLEISPMLRADFADATGVGMGQQLQLEAWFAANRGCSPSDPVKGSQWAWASKLSHRLP